VAVRGAAGVLVLWLGFGCARGGSVPPPPDPDAARAFAHLEAQVAFGPRVPGSPAAIRCRRYLAEQLAGHTDHVGVQSFRVKDPYGPDSLQLENVVANFFTDRPRRVLLCAHYDSRPRADRDTGAAREQPVPGANDGASGAAVLLEVAEILGSWDPRLGVDLLFLDGEDYGQEGDTEHYLLGSRHFAATMGAYRPEAVMLLDMVGERDVKIPMEGYSLREAPGWTRFVFAVAESLGERAFLATPGPAIVDDHIPFLQHGIPALDLIDIEYPAWHTVRDTPDQCSPASLNSVARVLLHTLWHLGRSDRLPPEVRER
jgi:hypothetical protein